MKGREDIMNKTIVTWIAWLVIIVAVLAGGYLITDNNQSATSGQGDQETPASYGH